MRILGVSAWYHDSAACLIDDGVIFAAVQEERFTRKKHDPSFPKNSINYCLEVTESAPKDIDLIVFYEKPFSKFERILETYLAFAPKGFKSFSSSLPLWIKEKLFQKKMINDELRSLGFDSDIDWDKRLRFSEHHLSHAASAFFPSPFESAAILTIDGVGEWTTTSMAIGNGNDLKVHKEIHFPHSLGLLYSAFTYYTGFRVNSGEYKVMGLAPYGEAKYTNLIKENLIDIKDDGSFHLDLSYFDYCTDLTMTSDRFHDLFGGPPRESESNLTQKEMDLAASIQAVTEEVVLKLAKSISKDTGERNLCLAGGVALNCVANGILLKEKIFENIWIQPAAGDAGGALGAALACYYIHGSFPRSVDSNSDSMFGSYLGPEYQDDDIEAALSNLGAHYEKLPEAQFIEETAKAIREGKAVGWMQGRIEFGPRALGGRSIIGDARSPQMQKQLNLKVKYRESFRPFAPSILGEEVSNWFEIDTSSPYMLLVANVKKDRCFEMSNTQKELFGIDKLNEERSSIPAVTHVDYSARIQTVHKATNPKYYALIEEFFKKTECPVIVNTSFNVRGEPIVLTPEDAFRCFMGTELDVLSIGSFILRKEDQDPSLKESYESKYELD
ncbi:carbamoyltransferase [Gammaproteobacteria bacterium]|nr:carbamoyltransferase [Gammaproteobacteria bacterium]